MEIVEEAKGRTDQSIEEKRKLLKKQGKDPTVEEDDPVKYKQAIKVRVKATSPLFWNQAVANWLEAILKATLWRISIKFQRIIFQRVFVQTVCYVQSLLLSFQVLTMKLFADLERKRRNLEQKISDDAAKKRETELAAEERRNMEKEFNKNWEESRQGRVDSWMAFKSGGKAKKKDKTKKFNPMGFKPPKTKPEAR